MKAVILSGGSPPSKGLVEEVTKASDIIIAADSGGDILYLLGIIPHYLVGDFDSIHKDALEYFSSKGSNILKYNPEKDCTDSELALKLSVELGAQEITFLGCTGSRIDHLMGNIGLLKKCLQLNIKAYIRDNNNTVFLTDKDIELFGTKGQYFSLQAYCDKVEKLTIRGAKYELNQYELSLGDPITISNEFTHEKATLSFASGTLMILLSKD